MDKTTESVKGFYDKTPFPDFELDRFNTKDDLLKYAFPFAKYLNRIIPKDASIVDVGCGTGQLAALLSLGRENVVGTDLSDTSLAKANQLKEKLDLSTLRLIKTDIFKMDLNEQFDYVLCLGVLHHTHNAKEGFRHILKLSKKGGYVAIGLYNKFGRISLYLRKFLLHTILRNNEKMKELFLKKQILSFQDKERFRGWYNDQFEHPHETAHTVSEVLGWFKENDVEYINSIPTLKLAYDFNLDADNLFDKDNINLTSKHIINQLRWIFTTANDGGYFITVGRKK
ncbi:MAG: class I SAM-dependent methyltransferase [Candidatus Aenigmarchaeota archaeon]|nr:class I SAM-dependent methyltransferase [Candidatus Aenigmarchaeota archaeon]